MRGTRSLVLAGTFLMILLNSRQAASAPADVVLPTPASWLPQGLPLANITGDPYFMLALQASSKGLRTLTVAVDANPVATLPSRINQVHLGMTAAGWVFINQSPIDAHGTMAQLLLTYRQ